VSRYVQAAPTSHFSPRIAVTYPKLSSPPVANLLLLTLGLPVLAAIAGWILAGHEPTHIARQPG